MWSARPGWAVRCVCPTQAYVCIHFSQRVSTPPEHLKLGIKV